ncbi:3 beta-hydroxysteroid dehydrogenase type 7 [Protopterus annectens]|uniref:3 beta-hydroxysteroid dehydrogenase type 7 n=1 Tax=Protopterus annectens TaxID=7888 RepID=UPI001CFB730A|nr:3 beta-hydroxysteroid dehydrogenase type 7 [Protopterus annectens]XP_043942167.1 3 beta-hydroxysteroid dehydrogenase type 7 [Protopterus annectens]XP_043942168.1 3 beta-hydroxysteroid dehydrogenase type 7 [Protopterus annectens]
METEKGQVYLVTGGCGFLGLHLVHMLVDRGENIADVRVFDLFLNESMKDLGSDKVKVKLIQGDITSFQQVSDAAEGADVVIHTASLVDVWNRVPASKIEEVNVQGTQHVIQACEDHGIQYLIYTSSMEVVGPNMNGDPFFRGNEETEYNVYHGKPYPKSKANAEKLVIKANGKQVKGGKRLYTCSLRPTGIYGENHGLMKEFYEQGVRMRRRMVRAIPRNTEHGRVYVGNVAWMHLLVSKKIQENPDKIGGQIYFCYDESPYKSYDDFNMEFLSACGFQMIGSRPVIPYFILYVMAVINDVLHSLLKPIYNYCPLMNKYTLAVATTTFTVSTDKAERHFGYKPIYSWEESKRRTITWIKGIDEEYQKTKQKGKNSA